MRILFRFDSSEIIGQGHLYRCCELGNFFEKKGHNCFYLTNNFDFKLINYFSINKNNLFLIKNNFYFKNNNSKNHFFRWKNAMQIEDAKFAKHLIVKNNVNIVFRDHYGLDHIWDKKVSENCRLVVIDDLKKKNYCDVYINYHYKFFKKKDYNLLLKKDCLPLLGKKYFVSKNINFLKCNNKLINQIFIYMGAADKNNFTKHIFNCLNNKILKNYKKVFLLNKKNKQHNKLYQKAKLMKGYKILFSPIKNIEKYYINSSLSITAAGASMYKQILCKANSLIIPQTYNQRVIANLLLKKKLFHILNKINTLNPKRILFAINNPLLNFKSDFLDCNGKSRILENIKKINNSNFFVINKKIKKKK